MKVLPVGTRLQCGSVLLEVTQIGKDCHSHCTIYYQMGKCIMPSNGIFARVLQEGEISVRDTIQVLPETGKEPFRAAVITLSDKGAAGEREDKSDPLAEKLLTEAGYMKEELLYGRYDTKQMTIEELKTLIWRYFIIYWNRRICSANGGLPPMTKRKKYYESLGQVA